MAIDKIWDGPRNADGQQDLVRPRSRHRLTGAQRRESRSPSASRNSTGTSTIARSTGRPCRSASIRDVAQDGSRNIADVTDTFGDLEEFEKSGGKLLTLVGGERPAHHAARRDQLLPRDGVPHGNNDGDFEKRAEVLPAVPRARRRALRRRRVPQPQNLFRALVNWVENGVAPEQIIASTTVGGVTRTRPLCPYPQTAIYNGSGSTDDAANFHCGGNLETARDRLRGRARQVQARS